MKRILIITITAVALSSCAALDDAEYADVISLGAQVEVPENKVLKSIDCPKEFGDSSFNVLANCAYTAAVSDGAEWLSFKGTDSKVISMEGNSQIDFSYTSNNGERRMAKIVLEAPGRTDTVCVRQSGAYESFVRLMQENLTAAKDGGEYSVVIESSGISESLRVEALDENLSDVVIEDKVLSFTVAPNTMIDKRKMTIEVYYLDGWEERISSTLTIIQN